MRRQIPLRIFEEMPKWKLIQGFSEISKNAKLRPVLNLLWEIFTLVWPELQTSTAWMVMALNDLD